MQHIRRECSSLIGGITTVEHILKVPLDWSASGECDAIEIFVRELHKSSSTTKSLPAVMFLQGGPGFPSPRPTGPPGGWIKALLDKNYRVLLLDQRGTGRSTAMTPQRLAYLAKSQQGVSTQVKYLKNMRSDAIANDIEAVRKALCGESGKISLMGQSFGGFCILSYMSRFPDNLDKCLFTCGLAPITRDVREVYGATYRRLLARNKTYYSRFPEDIAKVKRVVAYLHAHGSSPITLPGGGHLTARRFLQLGINLGFTSGLDSLHQLLEDPFFRPPASNSDEDLLAAELNESFLYAVEQEQSGFESSPIYWLMHESIYMNGGGASSRWAAEEVMQSDEFRDAFDYTLALRSEGDETYVNFTGEMVYSWMGQDYARLRPLAEAADTLAALPWDRPLYDLDALRDAAVSKVKCAALVSYGDMYVERAFSEETAEVLGGENHCKMWITNEFQHSGIRDDSERVVDTLLRMATNEVNIPS